MPTITVSGGSVVESDPSRAQIIFTVTLSEASDETILVDYVVGGGTALPDNDDIRTVEVRTLRFDPGQTSRTVGFGANDADTRDEVDEFAVFRLFNPIGADFGDGALEISAVGVIQDDDGAGNDRAVFVSSPVVIEGADGARRAVFDLTLSEAADAPLSFGYQTRDGSALAGADYVDASGQVIFARGQTTASVAVDLIGDTVAEASEFFSLVLDPPSEVASGGAGASGVALIVDDDTSGGALPTVSVEAVGPVTESASSTPDASFLIRLSQASPDDVTVSYRFEDGTALSEGADHFTSGSVFSARIPAGETTVLVSANVRGNETLDEADESIVIEVFNPVRGVLAGGGPVIAATAIIQDDDGPVGADANRGLFVSDALIVEGAPGEGGEGGGSQAVFEVLLSRPFDQDRAFAYTTIDGDAVAGRDYAAASGTLTFLAGQTRAAVIVDVTGDGAAERSEFFSLAVTPTDGIANGADGAVGVATIVDDDAADGNLPTLSISPGRVVESASNSPRIAFDVTLSAASPNAVTVDAAIVGGTASISGGDLFDVRQPVVFQPGQTSRTIFFPVVSDDARDEIDESVVIELSSPTQAVLAGGAIAVRATGVVLDDDGAGDDTAVFVSDAVLVETDGAGQQAAFEISLSRPVATEQRFAFETLDGSALAGADYAARSGVVTFAPGQTRAAVLVDLVGDTVSEGAEFFSLAVAPAEGAVPDRSVVGTATLLDDDAAGGTLPTLSVEAVSGFENDRVRGGPQFQVRLSEASADRVTVTYRTVSGTAAGDVDYRDAARTLTFEPGQTFATVQPITPDDGVDEFDEALTLELYSPRGAVFGEGASFLTASGFVLDDDGLGDDTAMFVSSQAVVEGDGAVGDRVLFEVLLSRPGQTARTFDYRTMDGTATAGDDYVASSGRITFAAGQTRAVVEVGLLADDVSEASEGFSLAVTGTDALASGVAGSVGRTTILDDDAGAAAGGLPVVSVARVARQTESASRSFNDMDFDIVLSAPSTERISVQFATADGAAVADTDYRGRSGSVTFSPGQTSQTVSVRVEAGDDIGLEGDEDLFLVLTSATNAVLAGGAPTLAARGVILDDDGFDDNTALFVSDTALTEAQGADGGVLEVVISRPSQTAQTFSYAVADGTALAGSDFLAGPGTFTVAAGATTALIPITLIDDGLAEATESFFVTIQPSDAFSNTEGGFAAEVTIRADDDASTGLADDLIFGGSEVSGRSDNAGNDLIAPDRAGAGDVVFGAGGDDLIAGGDGGDVLRGQGGRDQVHGEDGDDALYGGTGADLLYGGAGADSIVGGAGDDVLYGDGGPG